MAKFEFEDEGSRRMDAFSESPGARARRARILEVLAPTPGARVLDVGSGPGHQAFEMASVVGPSGRVDGIDPAATAIDIARHRCTESIMPWPPWAPACLRQWKSHACIPKNV